MVLLNIATGVSLDIFLRIFNTVNNLYFYSSLLTNTLQDSSLETPPRVLREHIKHCQKEFEELREFTVLEKQIYNMGCYEEVCSNKVHSVNVYS
jgi:hypothetical protein